MSIQGLDHVNILTSNMEETLNFYTEILDFTDGYRPPFDFPGAWLYAGKDALIHLVYSKDKNNCIRNPLDHDAFKATGFEKTKKRLENANLKFQCSDVPNSEIRQIFLTDPSGVKLELNFLA